VPMTKAERDAAFRKARSEQLKRLVGLQRRAAEEAIALLDAAAVEIRGKLAGASEFEAWRLAGVQRQVDARLDELGAALAQAGTAAAGEAWAAGVELVDAPIAVGGVQLGGVLGEIDPGQLMAMRSFMTDRLKDVAAEAGARIKTQLGLVMTGAVNPNQALDAIAASLTSGGRGRAITIMRTELGRAYSTAAHERMSQAEKVLVSPSGKPLLKKQWRRSGKRRSRPSHDLADGQIKAIDEPFKVGGTDILFPRHPSAPARHSVNCGCVSLPYMDDWELRHPGERPIGEEERGDPGKLTVEDARAQGFARWAKRLDSGKLTPGGHWETVAALPRALDQPLAARGIQPLSPDVGISDRKIARMRRESKKHPLPMSIIETLPDVIARPKAVLRHVGAGASGRDLVFVADVPGEDRLAKIVVKLGSDNARARRRRHNWILSGKMETRDILANEGQFELLTGSL